MNKRRMQAGRKRLASRMPAVWPALFAAAAFLLLTFVLPAQRVDGQEAVEAELFENRLPPKVLAERISRFRQWSDRKVETQQPPSLALNLSAPAAAILPQLAAGELNRFQPPRGQKPIGIHRFLPQKAAALSFSGGAAKTTVARAWQATVAGRLWRLRVTSPGARALRLHFQDFDVGEGDVWVHGANGHAAGPYNGRGMYGDGDFWSSIVFGESATIEYRPDPASPPQEAAPFRIAAVSHIWDIFGMPDAGGAGGRPFSYEDAKGSYNDAKDSAWWLPAPCFVDVSCGEIPGEAFSPYRRSFSTAIFAVEKNGAPYTCSGTLIDGGKKTDVPGRAPFFLTAGHCVESDAQARTLVAYWFHQTLFCGGEVNHRPMINEGATLLRSVDNGYGFDAALLLLAEHPPRNIDPSWLAPHLNNYYAVTKGEFPALSAGHPVVGFHHSNNAPKLFSFGHILSRRRNYYRVRWTSGQTSPGASGSALFSTEYALRNAVYGVVGAGETYERDPEIICRINPVLRYTRMDSFYPYIRNLMAEVTERFQGRSGVRVGGSVRNGTVSRFRLGPEPHPTLFTRSRFFSDNVYYRLRVPRNAFRVTFDLDLDFARFSPDVDMFAVISDNGWVAPGFSPDGLHAAHYSATRDNNQIVIDHSSNPPLIPGGNILVALALKDTHVVAEGTITTKVEFRGPLPSERGFITTVAGIGQEGYNGDGDSASRAILSYPFGMASDGSGSLYIADSGNHRIRKVDASGRISTVAGSGDIGDYGGGYAGDGGPAIDALLNRPYGVAADGFGNLYIADTFNHSIRKVDDSGTISTIAGRGAAGFWGDGGPAIDALLNHPYGVAADGFGNLYIADTFNHRIRKIDASGRISVVAGNGEDGFNGNGPALGARLSFPIGMAADGNGNLYIADWSNHRIRMVDASGTISTIAGSGTPGYGVDVGPSELAAMRYPGAVSLDGVGNLYIAEHEDHRIRKVKAVTGPMYFRDCAACPRMAVIPAGSFLMGSPESEEGRFGDEGQHRVTIRTPFATGVYEVTFEEWDACVAEDGCGGYRPDDRGWGRGRRPVINMGWEDAQAYVRWLSRKTGQKYRLLSEAEWEYAARAGTTTRYSFGDEITENDANYGGNIGKAQRVGSYRANGYGLYDMHGNAWEWVQDCWNDSYAGAPNNGEAWERGDCYSRVMRGGSWDNSSWNLRSATRGRNHSWNRYYSIGFRVARTLTP